MVLILSLSLFHAVTGYGQYREKIPNGNRVAHPCKPNYIWRGVGHTGTRGGGSRNAFGLDFVKEGYEWTETLCEKDSDGDGVSNGMELGDPDCKWSPGKVPQRREDITHPGVCTPFDSEKCAGQNTWVDCTAAELDCPAINGEDVQNLTLRLPRTAVPAEETTYICMGFDVPSDRDYHMIASKPDIDNDNVLHHSLIYGCEDDAAPFPSGPYACPMNGGVGCEAIFSVWSLGEAGDCLHENFGLLFGKSRFKRVVLEFHWNNPKKVDNWFDESAMIVYYTTKLRPNNGAMFVLGQNYLAIPPMSPSSTFTARCSPDCTKRALNESIYVTLATNHMHYLGAAQSVEQLRGGKQLRYITNDDNYNYDDPHFYFFETPIEVKPGDELVTSCTYSNKDSPKWVYYGDGTSSEMCFTFMWFYPAEAMSPTAAFCLHYKSLEVCSDKNKLIDGCDLEEFFAAKKTDIQELYHDLKTNCVLPGETCTQQCTEAAARARKNPCLKGGHVAEYIQFILSSDQYSKDFIPGLEKCAPLSVPSACHVIHERWSVQTIVVLVLTLMTQWN